MSEITKAQAERWLKAYGAAWETGDINAIAALFDDRATYQETPFDPPMRGAEQIQAYWREGAVEGQTGVSFRAEVWAVSGNEVYAGWSASFQRKRNGASVELDGVFRLTLIETNKSVRCTSLREWWHRRETAPTAD